MIILINNINYTCRVFYVQSSNQAPVIHPAVHKYIGKAPVGSAQENVSSIKKEVTQECGQMTSTAIHKTVTKVFLWYVVQVLTEKNGSERKDFECLSYNALGIKFV